MTHPTDHFEVGDRVERDESAFPELAVKLPSTATVKGIENVPDGMAGMVGHVQWIDVTGHYMSVSGAYYRKVEG